MYARDEKVFYGYYKKFVFKNYYERAWSSGPGCTITVIFRVPPIFPICVNGVYHSDSDKRTSGAIEST